MMKVSLLKISSINIALKFISLGLIFLFQSSISKSLTVDSYSEFSKFIVYSSYLSLILSFGLSASIVYYSNTKEEFFKKYINILFLYSGITLLCFAILLFTDSMKSIYANIISFSILLNFIALSLAYYQYTSKFVLYALLGMLQAFGIVTILVIMYLFDVNNIEQIIQLYIVVNFVFFFILFVNIYRENKSYVRFEVISLKKYFSYGFKLVPLLIIGQIIYVSDYFLIDLLLEDKYLAYYFVAMMISKMVFVLADTVGNILFPLYVKLKDDLLEKSNIDNSVHGISSVIFIISILLLLLYAAVSNEFIDLFYTREYKITYTATLFLIAGTQGMIIYKLLSRKLASEKKWKILYQSLLWAAAFNILLNLFLIPRYGINGAAFSSMLSYWLCGILIVRLSGGKVSNYLFYPKKLLLINK